MEQNIALICKDEQGKSEQESAKATIVEWNKSMATVRALKVLGGVWLGAVLSVAIPIVHWVTVPTGLIVGPLAGWFIFKKSQSYKEFVLDGVCPHCHQPLQTKWSAALKEVERTCQNCQTSVTIQVQS